MQKYSYHLNGKHKEWFKAVRDKYAILCICSWLAISARHCSPTGVQVVSLKPGVLGGAGGGADGHVVLAKDVVLRYVHIVPVLLDDDDHHPDGG